MASSVLACSKFSSLCLSLSLPRLFYSKKKRLSIIVPIKPLSQCPNPQTPFPKRGNKHTKIHTYTNPTRASIANFIRIAALAKLGTYKDPLFDAADVFLWSFIEVSLGITVAGLLELAPLMQRLRFKGFGDIDQQGAFAQFDRDSDVIRLVTVGKPKTFDA